MNELIQDLKLDNEYLKSDNDSLKAENLALQNKIKKLEFKYNDLFLKYAESQNKLMETGTPKIIYKEKQMEGEITQWEYKTLNETAPEKQLNELGKEGWEVSGNAPSGSGTGSIILKRPKTKTSQSHDYPGYGR